MSRECHPVWRDLHWGRIRAAQSVDEVVLIARPKRTSRYGAFEELDYQEAGCYTGVTIRAKDGRVAHAAAWSCGWQREFFDDLTAADKQAYSAAREAHWLALAKNRELAEQRRESGQAGP